MRSVEGSIRIVLTERSIFFTRATLYASAVLQISESVDGGRRRQWERSRPFQCVWCSKSMVNIGSPSTAVYENVTYFAFVRASGSNIPLPTNGARQGSGCSRVSFLFLRSEIWYWSWLWNARSLQSASISFFTLVASIWKRNVTVWRPSVRLSVSPVGIFTVTHQKQLATRPAYI